MVIVECEELLDVTVTFAESAKSREPVTVRL